MEFRILGPVEIVDGERVLPLGGLKRRAVAAVLLLQPNRVVASEQLIDLVWGDDPPATALSSLQNHVLRLRRELGDRLVTRPPGYLLRVEPGELDLDRFRRLVEEARRQRGGASPPRCSGRRSRCGEEIRSPTWRANRQAPRRRTSPSFASRRSRAASTRTWRLGATRPSFRSSTLW